MTTNLNYLRGKFDLDNTMDYENLKSKINSFIWNHNNKPVTINIIKKEFDIPRRLSQIILDELTFQGYLENVQLWNSKFSAYQSIYNEE